MHIAQQWKTSNLCELLSHKRTLYIALMGELWGVPYEYPLGIQTALKRDHAVGKSLRWRPLDIDAYQSTRNSTICLTAWP